MKGRELVLKEIVNKYEISHIEATKPISALLSQVLVAYTVELDNDFELDMSKAGFPGARLSLVVWFNLIRLIHEGGTIVRDLQTASLGFADQVSALISPPSPSGS